MAELSEVYRKRRRKRGVDERREATIVADSHSRSVVELNTPASIRQPPPPGPGLARLAHLEAERTHRSQSASWLVSASVCTHTVSAAPMASLSRCRS